MKIVCAGGGTLGSVTPLLAVIEELQLRRHDLEVEWWGTQDGPERALVEHLGIKFSPIPAGKLRRYQSFHNFTDLGRIAAGLVTALWRFGQQPADMVLTAGSFVAVPVGWAAWCYHIPLLVHQLDVRPGLANRLLAPFARRITVTFPDSLAAFPRAKTVLTGNPVRQSFLKPPTVALARAQLGLGPNQPVLLVVGGGTGAIFLNQLIARTLPQLTKVAQVVHVTGQFKLSRLAKVNNYHATPFALDTLPLLAAADVVVTRAGMMFLSELAVLGKAVVCVPIPGSQQEDNTALLARHDAAVVLQQNTLTDQAFVATVLELLRDHSKQQRLGNNLRDFFPARAAQIVAREVLTILQARDKLKM